MKHKTQGVKMKNLRIFILIFILLLTIDSVYAGGGNRTGTGGVSQLLIPVGARGISMSGANIATATGLEALFWNPAGVAKMQNSTSVFFSHMNYIADIGVEYGAVSANFEGFGVLAFNIKSLSIGEILTTTNTDPDGTGSTFSPQMLSAGLTYSRMLTDVISVGLTANLVTETLGDVSATGVAFSAGVIYDNLGAINGLSFGVAVKNIGPQMQFDGPGLLQGGTISGLQRPPGLVQLNSAPFELPSSFELGFGYRPTIGGMNSLLISTSYQNNNFSGDEYKLGAEYNYNNMFFLRGGYTLSPKSQVEDYIYGLAAGVGFNYNFEGVDIKIDYAFRDVKYFDGNHIFAITLGF